MSITDPTDPYAGSEPPPPPPEEENQLYGWWEFISGAWRWITEPPSTVSAPR